MRTGRALQPLSYDLRLPDEAQGDALRLLDASRAVVNTVLETLWPFLDEFLTDRASPAWKQVVALVGSPAPHGDRQWRCEAETAGRIMRAQATRKQVFRLIQPILCDGFIRPKTEKRSAGKDRTAIKAALEALHTARADDDTALVTMQNVVEQACNYFLLHGGEFPTTYEQMQGIPRLTAGLLTYSGDDGGAKGQAYRFSLDLDTASASLLFRYSDVEGIWRWRNEAIEIALPPCVLARLQDGTPQAPTLRALVTADGSRIAVLDLIVEVKKAELPDWQTIDRVLGFDWGVHGLLTAVVLGTPVAGSDSPRQLSRPLFLRTGGLDGHQARTRRQIDRLNTKQAQRVQEASTPAVYEAEIWRIVRYKCHLLGVRFRSEHPRGTSHTCPRCGKPAETYRSPRAPHRVEPVKWGRWLVCAHCSFNADRDYAAAVNVARLGMAYLTQIQTQGKAHAYSMTDEQSVKPCPYMAHGAVPLFPPQTLVGRLLCEGKIYLNGWKKSCTIRSSYTTPLLLRLCS